MPLSLILTKARTELTKLEGIATSRPTLLSHSHKV
jgi:hypothetical protein